MKKSFFEDRANRIFEYLDEDADVQWAAQNLHILNSMMDCVRRGDTEGMRELIQQDAMKLEVRLAEDESRHTKDLVIILIQMLSMAASSGGLPDMLALRLKEQYIRQLEQYHDLQSVHAFADAVKMDFCTYVRELQSPRVTDIRIQHAIEYIDSSCTKKITLKELSDPAGVSREHFVRLFKAQLGMTPQQYIRKRKIMVAEKMLTYTEESLSAISAYLAFSSQPYFQKVFRDETGMTPLAYRRKAGRS